MALFVDVSRFHRVRQVNKISVLPSQSEEVESEAKTLAGFDEV